MRIFVLMDFNGTICYRSVTAVDGAPCHYYENKKFHYKRSGIERFVGALKKDGRFVMSVYSSVMYRNLKKGLDTLFPTHRNYFSHYFHRDMNIPDPNGQEGWETIRDMEKPWRDCPGFDATNTIILDNESRKFGEWAGIGIVVPEYGPQEIRQRRSNTLDKVLNYLLHLADSGDEVSKFLRDDPFWSFVAEKRGDKTTVAAAKYKRRKGARGKPKPRPATKHAVCDALASLSLSRETLAEDKKGRETKEKASTPEDCHQGDLPFPAGRLIKRRVSV